MSLLLILFPLFSKPFSYDFLLPGGGSFQANAAQAEFNKRVKMRKLVNVFEFYHALSFNSIGTLN